MADELVLAHPSGHVEARTLIAAIAGPALYLVGASVFRWMTAGSLAPSHIVGLIALGLLPLGSAAMTPLTLAAASTLVLVALCRMGELL